MTYPESHSRSGGLAKHQPIATRVVMQYFSGHAGMKFFPADTPKSDMPRDAVEVSERRRRRVESLISQGYELSMDEFGRPLAIMPVQVSIEDLDRQAREKRGARLRNTDWVVMRATEGGGAPSDEVIAYRQALRDLPEQSGYPVTIDWPDAPASV